MSIKTLLQGDVAAYFRDNADTPDTLWVFQHIPKTAGSSFRTEIARKLRPQANVALNGMGGRKFATVQSALDTFLGELRETPFRFASGHLSRPQIEAIQAAHPRVRLVTMLRDPVERVISDFRYQRTPKHAGHEQFIERFPSFESYLESPLSHNRQFEFLRRGPEADTAAVIADLESHYAFVGLTEMYPLARHLLLALIGIEDAQPPETRNRTEARAENEIPGLDALRPRIRELNAQDEAIYEHFRAGLRAQREPLQKFLRQRRAAGRRPAKAAV